MHYPPVIKQNIDNEFMRVLRKYNIKRCYYAHLHGKSINEAVEGKIYGIDFKLVSADALDFKLLKIQNFSIGDGEFLCIFQKIQKNSPSPIGKKEEK